VLWRGGLSFSGAIAFVFGDLIIIPILNIYRKYYGGPASAYLFVVSYAAMVLAGLLIGAVFNALALVPANRHVGVFATSISWDANTGVNIAFIVIMAALLVRFLRTGGVAMLRAMEHPPERHSRATDPHATHPH
jgi:hypothetical protein